MKNAHTWRGLGCSAWVVQYQPLETQGYHGLYTTTVKSVFKHVATDIATDSSYNTHATMPPATETPPSETHGVA